MLDSAVLQTGKLNHMTYHYMPVHEHMMRGKLLAAQVQVYTHRGIFCICLSLTSSPALQVKCSHGVLAAERSVVKQTT